MYSKCLIVNSLFRKKTGGVCLKLRMWKPQQCVCGHSNEILCPAYSSWVCISPQETSRPSESGSRHSPPLHHIQWGSENRCEQDWRVPGRCSGPTQVSVKLMVCHLPQAQLSQGISAPRCSSASINWRHGIVIACHTFLPSAPSSLDQKPVFSVRLFLNYPLYTPVILSALSDSPFWWQAPLCPNNAHEDESAVWNLVLNCSENLF